MNYMPLSSYKWAVIQETIGAVGNKLHVIVELQVCGNTGKKLCS